MDWHYFILLINHLHSKQIPDSDLEKRRIGQRVDPLTGDIYTVEVYNPDKPEPKKKEEGEEDEEEEEAEEEQEEEVRKCVASKILLRIPVVLLA